DSHPLFAAGRNVLKVRVRRAEPSGGGERLMERGMNPARGGVDQSGKRVAVSGLELRDGAVLKQLARQLMGRREFGQRVRIGRVAAFGFLETLGRELQIGEQDLAQLKR